MEQAAHIIRRRRWQGGSSRRSRTALSRRPRGPWLNRSKLCRRRQASNEVEPVQRDTPILKDLCRWMSAPCRRRSAIRVWTAGCSTTSTDPIPIAQRLAGLGGGGHLATRRWFYLIPATGEPRGLVHEIERHNLDRLPGAKTRYAGRDAARGGADAAARRHVDASRWSTRRCGAIPYVSRVDAGTIELVRGLGVEVVSSGDLVQQFEAHWTTRRSPRIARRPRSSIASRIGRSRPLRARPARRHCDHRVRHPAADGRLVQRRRPDQRLGAERLGAGERRQSALSAAPRCAAVPIRADELVLLDLWGKLDTPARSLLISRGSGSPARRCPTDMASAFAAIARRARRGGRARRGSGARRTASCAASKSTAPRAGHRAAGYGDAILHRTGHSLGENGARQRRAPGRLRDARRTAAAARHRLHH